MEDRINPAVRADEAYHPTRVPRHRTVITPIGPVDPDPRRATRRPGALLCGSSDGRSCQRVPELGPGERIRRTERRTDRLRSAAPGLLFGGGLSDLTFVVLPVSAPRCTLKPSTGRRAPWAS